MGIAGNQSETIGPLCWYRIGVVRFLKARVALHTIHDVINAHGGGNGVNMYRRCAGSTRAACDPEGSVVHCLNPERKQQEEDEHEREVPARPLPCVAPSRLP